MNNTLPTLYYIHDPMCSWCWGFRTVWDQVQLTLADKVNIQYVLGGLAADTSQAMPDNMQQTIQQAWQQIQQKIPGTEFNYDFWTLCHPRRSTYPACRAVIAAGMQGEVNVKQMLLAIQKAYYLQAKNPSNDAVLIQLAINMGLQSKKFTSDLNSEKCQQLFEQQRQLAHNLGINGFPSLVLRNNGSNTMIHIDYTKYEGIVSSIIGRL